MDALQWLEQSAALAAERLNATDEGIHGDGGAWRERGGWVATRQAAGRAAKKAWGHPPRYGTPQPWCGHQHYAPPHACGAITTRHHIRSIQCQVARLTTFP